MTGEFDVIVVGAGSAGCAVAARLAAAEHRRVLLLEAGPNYLAGGDWPPNVLNGLAIPQGDDWGYTGELPGGTSELPLRRGRLVGGSSAVNYCIALRGRPADHDAWAALGLPRWSWSEVLPFYMALENDAQGDRRWHGRAGPTPVTRCTPDELTDSQSAFLQACATAGFDRVADLNAPEALGAGITPRNCLDGRRVNAANAYLAPVADRKNLVVAGNAEVRSVDVEHGRAVGVRLTSGAVVRGEKIVLAAGSYATPKILLLSGIGPADRLRRLGIDVMAEVPGVGAGLIEHASFPIVHAAKPEQRRSGVPALTTTLTLRSAPQADDLDLHVQASAVLPTRAADDHPTGHDFVMVVCLVHPESRGSVRLRSADPAQPPLIELGIHQRSADVRAIAQGVQAARRIAEQQPLRELLDEERQPGGNVTGETLDAAIRAMPLNYHHPMGTCRMGPPGDREAVVDEHCRVRSVENLHIIDASVMPVSVRSTTHLPTLMLAERAVALNWPS